MGIWIRTGIGNGARRRAVVIAVVLAVVASLGAGPAGLAPAPARAAFDPGVVPTVTQVEAGANHTCAVFSDGTARCWGFNPWGNIGDGTTTWPALGSRVLGLEDVVDLSAGYSHTCAVEGDGSAWCWGDDAKGQLGDDAAFAQQHAPVRVSGITDAVAVSAGTELTCVLRATGGVACFGSNDHGQLGLDPASTTSSGVPVDIAGITDAVDVAVGGSTVCVVHATDAVSCWGFNNYGQLGDGSTTDSVTPVAVTGVAATRITLGYRFACAIATDATVTCWGANYYWQLGDGYDPHQQCSGDFGTWDCSPTPVTVLDITTATDISAGDTFTCATLEDTTARCWGINNGNFGNGASIGSSAVPVAPTGLTGAVGITGGNAHACALLDDATASCWGMNDLYQLGTGTTDTDYLPTPVDTGVPTLAFDPATTVFPTSIGFKVVFDTAVTDLTVDAFSTTGTTALDCVLADPVGSGTTWTVAMNGCTDGDLQLTLLAGSAVDGAGIARPPFPITLGPIRLDTTGPWIASMVPGASPTKASTVSWSVTTSEPVTGFTASDISFTGPDHSATGCVAGTPVQDPLDDLSWTVTAAGCGSGQVQFTIPAGAFEDAAGNAGPSLDVLADVIVVDRTAPTVSTPTVAMRTGARLSGSQVPVRVAWTATDNAGGTGIASMQLERSLDGGAWTAVGPASLATKADVLIPSSGTVQFRVRAVDMVGNQATKASAVVTPRLVQQTSATVTWKGTWTTVKDPKWSGGSARYAKAKGASVSITFTGRSVAFVSANATLRGKAKVYVNGTYVATIDLGGTAATRVLAWKRTWSTSAKRTVKIVVSGTSGRPRVDADAFVVFR